MSTPHCSFVIYLFQDHKALPLFIQDFRVFFQKFPLRYELICVIDDNLKTTTDQSIFSELKKNAPENESWQILQNPKKEGRAQSLCQGARQARGEFIIFPSVTMSTPLGDLFKILQHLMSDPNLSASWGERYSKKSAPLLQATCPALKIEHLFNKILKEKNPLGTSVDPLCEVGGIRQSAWRQIQDAAEIQKARGWFLAFHCQKVLRQQNLAQNFLYIHDSGNRTQDFSPWHARWELLRQSLFKTL